MHDNQISRRGFLTKLGVGSLAILIGESTSQTAYTSESKKPEEEYKALTNVGVKIIGRIPILRAKFQVRKKDWDALPKGLSKQKLYEAIENTDLQYEITALADPTSLPRLIRIAVNQYHQGFINNEDIRDEFLKRAKQYTKEKSPSLDLDSNLRFKDSQRKSLERALSGENLRSSVTGKINPWWGWERKVQVYPPNSKITFKSSSNKGSIQVSVKTRRGYNKQNPVKLTNKNEIEALHNFFMFSLLSKDPILKDRPINVMFKTYNTGQTLERDFSLSREEAVKHKK